jgi:hypothetical protein
MPGYLDGFNFNPNSYMQGQQGLTGDMNSYMGAGQGYADSLRQGAQGAMSQALQGANRGRQGLLGQIGSGGNMRSMMMGGAGAGNLQQFDQGVGQQIGQIGTGLNQQLGQLQMGQQQTMMDARNQALQQQMWQKQQGVGGFDLLGLGLTAAQAVPGIGQGIGFLGKALGI